jgi:hypothetical protein
MPHFGASLIPFLHITLLLLLLSLVLVLLHLLCSLPSCAMVRIHRW